MQRRPRTPFAGAEGRCAPVQVSDHGVNARENEALSRRRLAAPLRAVDREVFPVLVLVCSACLGLLGAAGLTGSDSWLSLVSGRVVVHEGIPHHDTLTVWTLGRTWVDQQWLAHVTLYGLFVLGGLSLLVVVALAATLSSVAALIALARRRGGTRIATSLVTIPLFLLILPGTAIRAQTLAYPLLAVLLWLLWGDRAGPSPRRLALTLPVLVLWGNVHGSVLLGAGLMTLVAGEAAVLRRDVRLLAYPVAALAAIFVSPYALELIGYYRKVILNPSFGELVTEWRPPSLEHQSLFFAVAASAIVLVLTHLRRFAPSELAAFALTAIGAFFASRNIVWFAFLSLVLLPRTIDVRTTRQSERHPRVNATLVAIALAVAAVLILRVASQSDAQLSPSYRPAALAAVQRGTGPIWADEHYADWLLYTVRSTRGQVIFDARFELLTARELTRISRFRVRGARTLLVRRSWLRQVRALLACNAGRIVYLDNSAVVASFSAPVRTTPRPGC
jgi:hypothetical protein